MMEKAAAVAIDIFLGRRDPPDASFLERSITVRDLLYYVPEACEELYRERLTYEAELRAKGEKMDKWLQRGEKMDKLC